MKKQILLFIFSLFNVGLYAVPALQKPITFKQSDGKLLTLIQYGDEKASITTTIDGYLLTQTESGDYEYAFFDENKNVGTYKILAHSKDFRNENEANFLKTVLPLELKDVTFESVHLQKAKSSVSEPITNFPLTGSPKSLVILVSFSDVAFTVPNPQVAYSRMLNEKGYSDNGATGSARDYFSSCSMGQFNPIFDVVGPFTLPNTQKYYGANDNYGNKDLNSKIMVIDACRLAFEAGVKFNNYDIDADGYVDNIFIYFAGGNEAEGAGTNTLWPQRNNLTDKSLKYNTKFVYDYAFTSELRFYPDTVMCGIGTFAHEFGHVLGLHDLYTTNGGSQHTLSTWDIMDYGSYLNKGITPPTYSAFERFSLGWLMPTVLSDGAELTLSNLSESNKAYLVSDSATHNLNGKNPFPKEFFLLENRQKTGWDSYLPSNGMLITRINYDSTRWVSNSVNNNSKKMGVDIMEADNIADNLTLPGDIFPSSGENSYTPTNANGTILLKPITDIQDVGGVIRFKFMGGPNSIEHTNVNDKFRLIYMAENLTIHASDTEMHKLKLYDFSGKLLLESNFIQSATIPIKSKYKGLFLILIDNVKYKVVL